MRLSDSQNAQHHLPRLSRRSRGELIAALAEPSGKLATCVPAAPARYDHDPLHAGLPSPQFGRGRQSPNRTFGAPRTASPPRPDSIWDRVTNQTETHTPCQNTTPMTEANAADAVADAIATSAQAVATKKIVALVSPNKPNLAVFSAS